MHGNVRPPSRLPAVQTRSRLSTNETNTLSPSAASSRSQAPPPVVRGPAITAGLNVRPPSWLVATTACFSGVQNEPWIQAT